MATRRKMITLSAIPLALALFAATYVILIQPLTVSLDPFERDLVLGDDAIIVRSKPPNTVTVFDSGYGTVYYRWNQEFYSGNWTISYQHIGASGCTAFVIYLWEKDQP